MFEKAHPQQARLKIGFYGPPGSGKTLTSLLAEGLVAETGKRVAFVDTERGTDFYAKRVAARAVHPDAFDFDALYSQSLADALRAVRSIDTDVYGVVVIDSISHLWDAAIAAWDGKKTKTDGIPMYAWGPIKKPYKELVRLLLDSPLHVIICGRQKNVFENSDGNPDRMIKVGVGMRAEGETEYEPHISCRFEMRRKADGTDAVPVMIVEKDRTGVQGIGAPNHLA